MIILEILGILMIAAWFIFRGKEKRNNVKKCFQGMKAGVVIVNRGTNNKNIVFSGFIEQEFISKGAKITPVVLRCIKELPKIENLKEITLNQEEFDFLVVGELKTTSKTTAVFTSLNKKNPNQECLDLLGLPPWKGQIVKTIEYVFEFRIFSYKIHAYTGYGFDEASIFLGASPNLAFKRLAESLVNKIYITREKGERKGQVLVSNTEFRTNRRNISSY